MTHSFVETPPSPQSATAAHSPVAWKDKVIFMTGGSRGIGRAIALRLAVEGASIVIAAKTAEPHARLSGTIHSVAEEIRAAGGDALPLQVDVRDEAALVAAIAQAAAWKGRIDVLINNAGALSLTPIAHTPTSRFDLMHALNVRAPFIAIRECLPHLTASQGHILSMCPPLNLDPGWLGAFMPYTLSKYGMTLLHMGLVEEIRHLPIRINTLWPATLIATAAVEMTGGEAAMDSARKPESMSDAAFALLDRPALSASQVHWLDEDVLLATGCTDLSAYAVNPERADKIQRDFYIGRFGAN